MSVVSILAKSPKMPLEFSKIDFFVCNTFLLRGLYLHIIVGYCVLAVTCATLSFYFLLQYAKLNYSQEKSHDMRIAELFA